MGDNDLALVRMARAGDRGAFEELVRRTSRLVYARLYLETGDAHRAEDLLQETYLSAFRSLGRLSNVSNFRPWLLTIALNSCRDAARRDTRLKRTAPPPTEPPPAPPPDDEVQREEVRSRVLAVLRSLPEEYRLPLTLRYIGGADYETTKPSARSWA
jgi:RNA polymerase sigma-70 factor (ECF subfamily)